MRFEPERWVRLLYEDTTIYLSKEEPNWFVPNSHGDRILQDLERGISPDGDPFVLRFLHSLPSLKSFSYEGRSRYLRLDKIKELWFHITNRCNLSCSHCLFSCSPKDRIELSLERIIQLSNEAYSLGCNVFVLTGGEPFVHPEIEKIIDHILSFKDVHLCILTNGMNLSKVLKERWMDPDHFHLQISVDGKEERHDKIRGKGTFSHLIKNLLWLKERGFPFTLSICVTKENASDMPYIVELASEVGAKNVHFMWYFIRGRGKEEDFAPTDLIFENFVKAARIAEERGIMIDNIESFKTQVFAPSGTIHDGTTAGWESLAIGPDDKLYPSAALIGMEELSTDLKNGLEHAWKNSPILNEIRSATAKDMDSPFRFILGGGDLDHSYTHKRTFIGDDPYIPLYERIVLWLIAEEARSVRQVEDGVPKIRLRMGEILESCGAHGKVALVHPNCLLATAGENSLSTIKSFYSEAVGDKKADILNPVCYDPELLSHIPKEFRFRGYGCGSPVLDADIKKGEVIVDLGCGTGVECFIAARLTGPKGKVIGVDMLDEMLEVANRAKEGVVKNLGYENVEFRKGYLEDLPLEDSSVDLVISNCVMNLSVNKRKAFSEIYRVLKPGGRLVISDVVCEEEPDPSIKNDETLRGECIAGALTQRHLMSIIYETGFSSFTLIKRFPYREVQGHIFYSLTFQAKKPRSDKKIRVIYRGPLPYIVTEKGDILYAGEVSQISEDDADILGDQIFVLDEYGNVTNIEAENTCCCMPEGLISPVVSDISGNGCLLCGAPVTYLPKQVELRCVFCQRTFLTNSICENGHYVCDECHKGDAKEIIESICLNTKETDMIKLLEVIRSHPRIPMHGPEHHAIVPGIILATYRNLGGEIDELSIQTGIDRGNTVTGGYCAFMGACGAAIGVGIAFSIILGATPLTPKERKISQNATLEALKEIARFKAARCCQRDSYLALKKAAEISERYLPIGLKAEYKLSCEQKELNRECIGKACPLY